MRTAFMTLGIAACFAADIVVSPFAALRQSLVF
jgi:hypothetical protein